MIRATFEIGPAGATEALASQLGARVVDGATASVLARLTRLCGADYVIVGAFGGTLFDDDAAVEANLEAVRSVCGGARAAVAVLGGGLGPGDVTAQAARAGGEGLLACQGSAAYRHPGGFTAGVAAAVEALGR